MKYYIKTYGCQMNVHESEKIAGILEGMGYLLAETLEAADIIVFNTCCIRENAENKALGNIGAVKKLKRNNKDLIIAVVGCMTEQKDVPQNLNEKYPYIDIILGTHGLGRLGECIDEVRASRNAQSAKTSAVMSEYVLDEDNEAQPVRSSGNNAWVNIMYGCNNFCTYCIVPYVRGRERSRAKEQILSEITSLVPDYPEITLLGQNVNSYGKDVEDGTTFSELLRCINDIPGSFRIKFMTSHPKDFGRDTVMAIKACDKVSRFIHLPLQSGSTKVLQQMNRRYTAEEYLQKIEMLKSEVPYCGLSSDILVGFPGETDEDFEKTLSLVQSVRFDNLYMFVYSRRSGTVAAKLPNQVPEQIKTERIKRLVAMQRKIGAAIALEQVGKRFVALVEGVEGGYCVASTQNGKLVLLDERFGELKKQFVTVEITGAKSSKLFAKPILAL